MGSRSRANHGAKLPDSECSFEEKSASLPITDSPSTDPSADDPSDGGLLAWLQVAGCFFTLMNTWGIINTFGAYQNFYEVDTLRSHTPSAISWIGSIQGFLLLIISAFAGPIFDAGYSRTLFFLGSCLVVLALMTTSLIRQYYQAFLAQGVCFGIGAGMIFVPSLAIVSTYFVKHRSFALGVAISGSSLGGVVYPTLFHSLQPRIGFGWTTRIIGLVALLTLGFTNIVMRQRVLPAARRKLFDASALREAPYILCTAGLFFGFIGLYIPFLYITPYAHLKTGAGETLAFYFVPILNAASIFGRLIPNAMADRVGPLNMFVPSALACAVLAFTWIAVHSIGGLLVFAILYGFFSGTFVSLPPSTILSLSSDLNKVGTRLGMSFSVAGFGVLIGSPVGGALLNLNTGHFVRAQVFCAVVLTVSCASLVLARVTKVGWAVFVKA